MERKVILYLAMSLDGFIADKNGGVGWMDLANNGEAFEGALAKVTVRASPSRTERAVNSPESMLTALTPTPFRPTVFLKAEPPYLPPVFISLTAAASDLRGEYLNYFEIRTHSYIESVYRLQRYRFIFIF